MAGEAVAWFEIRVDGRPYGLANTVEQVPKANPRRNPRQH